MFADYFCRPRNERTPGARNRRYRRVSEYRGIYHRDRTGTPHYFCSRKIRTLPAARQFRGDRDRRRVSGRGGRWLHSKWRSVHADNSLHFFFFCLYPFQLAKYRV
ncbi:hypothetical protein PUN28_016046 [Cardiocondyla obscurior]|uniref:Uncharacterized protein n=1 Tax=Cardiocondyla obscurior TaxID=286306 RepID=A0AAW2ET58_9HYME